jgi:hypothetical protein
LKALIFVGAAHDPVGGAAHHAITLFARPKCLELEVLDAAEHATNARRAQGASPVTWANVIEIDDTMQRTERSSWKVAFAASEATLKCHGATTTKRCSNGEFAGLFPEMTVNLQVERAMRVCS